MLAKFDSGVIAWFQKFVIFVDHFFCITRKTLVLGFVGIHVVCALLYVNLIIRAVSYWIDTNDTFEKIVYFFIMLLLLGFLKLHMTYIPLGLAGKGDRSEFFIEQRLVYRFTCFVSLLLVCYLIVLIKYFSVLHPVFLELVKMGYFLLFEVFSCLVIEYLLCTKLPPPPQTRSNAVA